MSETYGGPSPQEKIPARVPPLPDTKLLEQGPYAGFAFSQQGASHLKKGSPCQDRCDIRCIADAHIVLAAVADGVGSCPLSHWGAYYAVQTVLDELERALSGSGKEEAERSISVPELFDAAFCAARRKIEDLADAAGRPVAQFQSTLTAAIYKRGKLYCCHVGDDGIVAQYADGTVEMVTRRMKGEEASSVYPLQTGNWEFTEVSRPVAGFVMATDGVLDHFVKQTRQIDYFNAVYYPFMRRAIYGLLRDGAAETAGFYRDTMSGPRYQAAVEDDLTLVSIADLRVLNRAQSPQFEKALWDEAQARWQEKVNTALYGASVRPAAQRTHVTPPATAQWTPENEAQAAGPAVSSTETRRSAAPAELRRSPSGPSQPINTQAAEASPKMRTIVLVAVVACVFLLSVWGGKQIRGAWASRQETEAQSGPTSVPDGAQEPGHLEGSGSPDETAEDPAAAPNAVPDEAQEPGQPESSGSPDETAGNSAAVPDAVPDGAQEPGQPESSGSPDETAENSAAVPDAVPDEAQEPDHPERGSSPDETAENHATPDGPPLEPDGEQNENAPAEAGSPYGSTGGIPDREGTGAAKAQRPLRKNARPEHMAPPQI